MDAIRRSKPGVKPPTAAASVWESRMKNDDIKGGIKVFNVDEDEKVPVNGVKRNNVGRKTWRSDTVKSPVQLKKAVEGKPKSPSVQGIRRLRSEAAGKSSIGSKLPELRKVKSDSGGKEIDAVSIWKAESEDEGSSSGAAVIENDGNEGASSVEEVDEEEKDELISSNLDRKIVSDPKADKSDDAKTLIDDDDDEFSEYGDEEKSDEEIVVEIEKKETTVLEHELVKSKLISQNLSKQVQSIEKPKPIIVNKHSSSIPIKPAVLSRIQKTTSTSSPISRPSPAIAKQSSTVHQKIPKRDSYAYERFPETQNKVQNLADLVMWRDVSKSAFVFGIGAFTIISSSYTKEVNISFVSVISYLGLVYLATIFLYRSIICRGYVDIQCKGNVLSEEDTIWLLRLVLPYFNEFLLKIKALFSGDPATTMKLAVLLFVLAKCGSSITIWNMAKLGFFGVFTIPKVCSAYSTLFTAYGNFWIRRFRDAWDSCSHKKAVAFGIFTLVWNFSSVIARIWTVFVLFVALRYYQQSLLRENWVEDTKEASVRPGESK